MIEALSHRMALKLKEANPDQTASVEVMSYALQGIIHNGITILTALLAGLLSERILDTIVTVVSFMGLRFVSGGFHFKSALACFLFSATLFIVIPHLSLGYQMLTALNIISLVIVGCFAPSNIKEHIRVSERFFPLFKVLSVFLVAINFFYLTDIITIAFFVQAITLISFTRR